MALQHLTEEQIRTWTREQKDTWWLKNVYRGNMRQLTIRSAITGFLLGGILSATNLYIGAKTGWTLGVGLTSVILAFAMFRAMSKVGLAKDFTILENNAMQSIATAAGYMTGPLISGIAAYMMVTNTIMPWWQMLVFNVILSILGVLIAFPMKRRFINDEQQPFPEGRACGVVLDTLYTSDASIGLFKAKVLAGAALFAGFLKFISGEAYQVLIQAKILQQKTIYHMSESLDAWYYKIADSRIAAGESAFIPMIRGIDIRKLGLSPTLDLAMFGAGGLMHIRYAANMMAGMILAYAVLGPYAVANGWVAYKGIDITVDSPALNRGNLLNGWLLWPGVAMLVAASLASLLAKPQMIISAFTGMFGKKQAGTDVLKDIELPLWISWVGVPIVGAIGVVITHYWFDVDWWLGTLAIALTGLLTIIAANATALTSITPTGSLSKITQFTFGALSKGHVATNLMTATMTTEVASNASNLLMDIKPGYMLGAKPRQQAIGHCIGIFSGALASTPLFFILFLAGHPDNPFAPATVEGAAKTIEGTLITEKFSFTAAVQWKGISDFINATFSGNSTAQIMHHSAKMAMIAAAIFGVAFEIFRTLSKGKSPISPLALGLGFVIPPDSTLWMFLGSLFFWVMTKVYVKSKETGGYKLWVDSSEAICAGLIAGAALTGIGDQLIAVLILPLFN